jgi:hypothetical protein
MQTASLCYHSGEADVSVLLGYVMHYNPEEVTSQYRLISYN